MNAAPLGVFDSGIGGLTVAHALFERLPRESVIYFGDTARVPYGPKSPETVRRYSAEILAYLLHRGVKAVVVACNTSTAHALESLRERSPVPVLGVIEPGARAAVAASRGGAIGVIGTAGTIASGAYDRAIKALRPIHTSSPRRVRSSYRLWRKAGSITPPPSWWRVSTCDRWSRRRSMCWCSAARTIRCSSRCWRRVLGDSVRLIDSAEETAAAAQRELEASGLLADGTRPPTHTFVISDDEPHFRSVGARFLGERLQQVEVVPLG